MNESQKAYDTRLSLEIVTILVGPPRHRVNYSGGIPSARKAYRKPAKLKRAMKLVKYINRLRVS